jgi:hypothetical protein
LLEHGIRGGQYNWLLHLRLESDDRRFILLRLGL